MDAPRAKRRRLPRPFLPPQFLRCGICPAFQRVPMTDWRFSRSRQRSGNSSRPPSKAHANPRPKRARTRSWCYETSNSGKKSANERSGSGESPTWRFTSDDFRNRADRGQDTRGSDVPGPRPRRSQGQRRSSRKCRRNSIELCSIRKSGNHAPTGHPGRFLGRSPARQTG